MDLQLTGKRALVTGSTTGIGRAIAEVLSSEGAEVVIHGRNRDRAEETAHGIWDAGGIAHVAIGDLANDQGAAAVTEAVIQATGGLDILVNNIGGTESSGPGRLFGWFDVKPEHWAGGMQQESNCRGANNSRLRPGDEGARLGPRDQHR